MTGTLHVIGAGVSGLAAALRAGSAGWRTILHEAAPQAGGRCRTFERRGMRHDNGTHVLFSANRKTLRLLDAIGARDRWVEPEPDDLPVVDLAGPSLHRVALSPWSWTSARLRPDGVDLADLRHLLPLLSRVGPDRTVASFAGRSKGLAKLLELMSVAILNTPPTAASARRLARVFRRMLLPGAAHLLVARDGLGPDLVEPLERAVARNAEVRFGRRLQSVVQVDGRAAALRFADGDVALQANDRVVMALPPLAASALLPSLLATPRHAPIVNLHVSHDDRGPIRFVGMTGGLAQWMLVRPGTASVTISAAGDVVDLDPGDLAARVWPDVIAAAKCCGIPLRGASIDRVLVVKERMATLVQDCVLEQAARPPRRPLDNLALAGDWMSDLPATIEAAVTSAQSAVDQIGTGPASAGQGRSPAREVAA